MTTGKSIIDEFLRLRWASAPHTKVRELILADPSAALPLALDALERIPEGANFVDEVLGFITPDEAAVLLARAFQELERDPSIEIAQGYVARLTLQFPELHPGGLDPAGDDLRSLHREAPLHLVFPSEYLQDDERPPWLETWHPTWSEDAGTTVARVPFGGALQAQCAFCSGRLHRLLEVPAAADVPFAPVTLATCLACLGWEEDALFYEHDRQGAPTSIAIDGRRHQPRFPSAPLREVEVALVDMGLRWRTQDWAVSSKENLHRLGGPPCWVQSPDYPKCPKCEQTMRFIAQLDSELPTTNGGQFLWGSGGLCYIFACAGCRTTGVLWQCT